MIIRNEWRQLAPTARADVIQRGVQANCCHRLWRAALGDSDSFKPASAGAGNRPTIDIDRLLEALTAGEHDSPVQSNKELPALHTATRGVLSLGANAPLQDAVEQAAARTEVPAAALAAIIDAEAAKGPDGRWNSLSRNPRSSAAGLGQFLSGTWIDQAQRPGSWLNETARREGWLDATGRVRGEYRATVLALRYDARASIEVTADYARANLQRLQRASVDVGQDDKEIARAAYLAHHLGPGDAVRFLERSLSGQRAGQLLAAQVGAGSAAERIAAAGDAGSAHRRWLNGYLDQRIRPERFTA